MRRKRLGKSGLDVGVLGFGCIKFGKMYPKTVDECLNSALDRGVNFIDTSRVYGDSEAKIGKALARRRDEFVLSSKAGALTKDDMKREIETSLRELGTDRIDLYGLHNVATPGRSKWDAMVSAGGAFEALVEAQREGKVGHVYFSCHRWQTVAKEGIRHGAFAAVMLAYNILNDELMDESVMPLATKEDVGVIIMKPLAGGALADPPEGVKVKLASTQWSIAQQSLRFILANPDVTVAIPGMTNMRELEENLAAAESTEAMTARERETFRSAVEELGKDVCRNCAYCMPCPEGILIPQVLRYEAYYSRYDMKSWARERYGMIKPNVEACTECGDCESKCPFNLKVCEKLKQAHELLKR